MAVCLVALCAGCAHYEYDIVRPPDLAQHVGSKPPVTFPMGDLTYSLQTSDNQLVMQMTNNASDVIKLLGAESYAVDPKGESHPLTDRAIPPGAHVKLVLPPPPQEVRDNGPHFGLGLGVGIARVHRGSAVGPAYTPGLYDDSPRYYTVYDPNDAKLWKWEGETEAKLLLTYERGGKRSSDEFVFKRVKK